MTDPKRPIWRRHAAGIGMAIVLAGMLVGPRWWLLLSSPPSGVRIGLSPWGADHQGADETVYGMIVGRAFNGELPVREPGLAARGGLPHAEQLWEQAAGQFGRLTGDAFSAEALITTLATLAFMLLLYVIALDATGSRRVSALVLPITLVVIQAFNQADGFFNLRHAAVLKPILLADPGREFHVWSRFVPPVMLLPLLFGAALALPRAVDSGRRNWIALAALLVALQLYSYIFYFASTAVALAAWGAWMLIRRDRVGLRRLTTIGIIAAGLALPELINLAQLSASISGDVSLRLGQDSHIGIDGTVVRQVLTRAIVAVPLVWALGLSRRRDALYAALFLAPLPLAATRGVVPQQWHFLTQVWGSFSIPLVLAAGAALVERVRPGRMRGWTLALATVAAVCLAYVGVLQARGASSVNAAYAQSDDEHAAFDWIRGHLGRDDSVVSSSITTNQLLVALTPASVYLPDGFLTRASDDELVDRYLRVSAAYGYDEQAVFARLDPFIGGFDHKPPYETRQEQFMGYYLMNWEVNFAQGGIADRLPAWRADFKRIEAEPDVLAGYAAQYLYCGPRERLWPAPSPASGTFVRVAFTQGDVTLYRLMAADDTGAQPFTGCV